MSVTASPVILVPSGQRRHVEAGWYNSRQSFTGAGNDRFGHLVVHNESVIAPASGFPLHGRQAAAAPVLRLGSRSPSSR